MQRIRQDQPDRAIAALLADLAAHGPATFAEMRVRLLPVMGEKLIRGALETLEVEARIAVDVKPLAVTRLVGGKPRTFVYRAKVYSVAKPRRKGGKRSEATELAPPLIPLDKPVRRLVHQQLVMDDIAAHGPSLCREVSARLAGVVNESDIHNALVELTKAGRLSAAMQNVPPPSEPGARGWRSRYRANVYSLPKAGGMGIFSGNPLV